MLYLVIPRKNWFLISDSFFFFSLLPFGWDMVCFFEWKMIEMIGFFRFFQFIFPNRKLDTVEIDHDFSILELCLKMFDMVFVFIFDFFNLNVLCGSVRYKTINATNDRSKCQFCQYGGILTLYLVILLQWVWFFGAAMFDSNPSMVKHEILISFSFVKWLIFSRACKASS